MNYRPGDTVYESFPLHNIAGTLSNADVLPTATLRRNGAGATAVTVTNNSAGDYTATVVIPLTWTGGDKLEVVLSYTMGGVNRKRVLSLGTLSRTQQDVARVVHCADKVRFVSTAAIASNTNDGLSFDTPYKTFSQSATAGANGEAIIMGAGIYPMEQAAVPLKPFMKIAGPDWNRCFIPVAHVNGVILASSVTISGLSIHGIGIGINGVPSAVTGIVNLGTTATVTQTAHGYPTGSFVQIQGASLLANNGIFAITNTGANTYTYTMGSTPGASPTGGITALRTLNNNPTQDQFVLNDNGANCDNVWLENFGIAGVTDCIFTQGQTNIRGKEGHFLTWWDYLVGGVGTFEFERCWSDVIGNALGPNPGHLGGVQAVNYATVRMKDCITNLSAIDAFGLPTVPGTGNVSRVTKVFHNDGTATMELCGGKVYANLPDETYTEIQTDGGGTGASIVMDFNYNPLKVSGNLTVQNIPQLLNVSGNGNTPVNENTGGVGNLKAVNSLGGGINQMFIFAYLTSEWTANPLTATPRAQSVTRADGTWVTVMMLNSGLSYTFVYQGVGYQTTTKVQVV